MAIIEVKGVSRSFRSVKKGEGFKGALQLLFKPEYRVHEALKNVSFSIEPGSFIGLIGANGAGKTTLLKILSGLIPPSQGEVSVLGYEPFSRPLDFRRRIALVMGQKAQLWWDLPAKDAFELLRAIYDIPEKTYKERVASLSGILDVTSHLHTQIRRLSLGERMKMELIGALLHWPSVIFLDEPTIGLDVLAAQKLRDFLRIFNQKEKATIILTSHNMDDIERLCSRVLILKSGELIYDGKPAGLLTKGEQRLRVRFAEKTEISRLSQLSGIEEAQISLAEEKEEGVAPAVYFAVKQEQMVTVLQKLMQDFKIIEMGIEEQSLETVISRIYGEGAAR